MTEFTDRQMRDWRSQHEAQLDIENMQHRAMLVTATAYRDHIAAPGVPEMASYAGLTTAAVAYIAAAPATVPVTLLGVAAGVAAVGLIGTTSHALRVFSHVAPSLAGSHSNAGEDLDKVIDPGPSAKKDTVGRIVGGRGADWMLDRIAKKVFNADLGGPRIAPFDKDEVDYIIRELEKQAFPANLPRSKQPPPPRTPKAPPPQKTFKLKDKAGNHEVTPRGDGRPYAGPDVDDKYGTMA